MSTRRSGGGPAGGGNGGAIPDRGGSKPGWSSNDDRSIVKNPTSPAYDADQANQKKQTRGS